MEEEETAENSAENNEFSETEELIEQNTEDDKSNTEELHAVENNEDADQNSNTESVVGNLEEDDEVKKDSEEGKLEEFELLGVDQLTEEERAEQEKQKEIKIDIFDNTEDVEALSEEEEEDGEEAEAEENKGRPSFAIDKESTLAEDRGSIYYEIGPRIRDLEDNQIVTGDFLLKEENVPLKFYRYLDEKDEEECEEESVSEEEEVSIDRVPYYEKHEKLVEDITVEKLKNSILQKKLAKFFKRRKMDHVLKETDQQFDTQEKYGKKLDAYGELSDLDYTQRTTITTELDNLKTEKESKYHELNKMFDDLQIQEKDTGYGLIHTKTGKPIPDKLVERLLHRQKHQMQTVGDMRLIFIQLKNLVAEKQHAISQLDTIGENLYLMDYEQLKVENRSYMDKMEERDEELSRLRNKCQKTIQILAHMREKSAALESDIYDLSDDLQHHNQNSMAVRGNLNKLKQQRDYYRNMTNKLRDESGLLTQSELLRDMEVSMRQLKSMADELQSLKEEHKIRAQQIRNIRKNIEFPPEGLIRKMVKTVSDKTSHGRRLYKGRPSLHKPALPEDAFKHLINFRGKPTFDNFGKK